MSWLQAVVMAQATGSLQAGPRGEWREARPGGITLSQQRIARGISATLFLSIVATLGLGWVSLTAGECGHIDTEPASARTQTGFDLLSSQSIRVHGYAAVGERSFWPPQETTPVEGTYRVDGAGFVSGLLATVLLGVILAAVDRPWVFRAGAMLGFLGVSILAGSLRSPGLFLRDSWAGIGPAPGLEAEPGPAAAGALFLVAAAFNAGLARAVSKGSSLQGAVGTTTLLVLLTPIAGIAFLAAGYFLGGLVVVVALLVLLVAALKIGAE
jgi:hypothetical protein